MDHIVLNVEDEDRMIEFYSGTLDLSAERLNEYRAGKVSFPSIRVGPDTIIDLFPKKMWRETAPPGPGRENLNHFCLSLDREEWDRVRERLDAAGVPVEVGPVPRWGAHGTGISIYFRDPEGNLVEARHYDSHEPPGKCLLGS